MTAFPLSAIVGQDPLREALLACAVDPVIGGVLVRGERGTAKSTAVRALAPLLPPVDVVAGDPYSLRAGEHGPDGVADGERGARPVRLVELPVGATADRLIGTLDLDRALADGARAFQPGLLAAAHRGILYVDEVNLLPDHLVDVLLDAAAMGRNHVERDAISVTHPARFLLVGTMNPEEGELRPQLTDRFGLSVEVAASSEASERVEVVRRRLAYDADPVTFAGRFADEERAVAARIVGARERLGRVRLGERELLLIAGTCARLGVDGMRADIVCARTATALAALDGADEVGEEHVRRAALLALAHRRRRGPLDPSGLDPDALDDALEQAREEAEQGTRGPDGDGAGGGAPPPTDDGGADGSGGPTEPDRTPAGTRAQAGADDGSAGREAGAGGGAPDGSPGAGEQKDAGAGPGDPSGGEDAGERSGRPEPDGRPAPFAVAPERRDAAAPAGHPPLLELVGRGRGAAGRRSRAAGPHGQPIDAREPTGPVTDLAPAATLRAAALRRAAAASDGAAFGAAGAGGPAPPGVAGTGAPALTAPARTGASQPTGVAAPDGPSSAARDIAALLPRDLREHVRAGREGNLVVFCLDASGSMGARRRMIAVKGAVLGLLHDAYRRRDRVALVSFRGTGAELVLPPTGSVERAAAALDALTTGGASPIAAGLERTLSLLAAERRRDPDRRALALLVTDGRASGGPAGRAAAARAATALAHAAAGVIVFDAEEGAVRLGLAAELAAAAGARLLPLAALHSTTHRSAA